MTIEVTYKDSKVTVQTTTGGDFILCKSHQAIAQSEQLLAQYHMNETFNPDAQQEIRKYFTKRGWTIL